jgi:hypothetical protein
VPPGPARARLIKGAIELLIFSCLNHKGAGARQVARALKLLRTAAAAETSTLDYVCLRSTTYGACFIWTTLGYLILFQSITTQAESSAAGTMRNGAQPDDLTPAERLDEIAEILAAGIIRVRTRRRAPRGSTAEQVSVDFSPRRSGHARPSGRRRRRA